MSNAQIKKMVLSALMAALVCVATMIIEIPSPANGYVNLGDCFVLLAAWLLGPWYGAAAAGLGSMLTDLFMGYAYYAPGTLVVKGLMAVVAAGIYHGMHHRRPKTACLVSGLAAEVWMVAGYFLYADFFLGYGAIGAAASILGNLVQGAVGLVAGMALLAILRRAKLEEKLI